MGALVKHWKTLALFMLALTAVFNVILLKEMPDNSGRTLRSVDTTPASGRGKGVIIVQKVEVVSRKLGQMDDIGSVQRPKHGLLRRWIRPSPTTTDAGDAGLIQAGLITNGQSLVEKYSGHPHLGGQSPPISTGDGSRRSSPIPLPLDEVQDSQIMLSQDLELDLDSAAEQDVPVGALQQQQSGADPPPDSGSKELEAELKEALIERPARLESLSEAFEHQQDIITAMKEANATAARLPRATDPAAGAQPRLAGAALNAAQQLLEQQGREQASADTAEQQQPQEAQPIQNVAQQQQEQQLPQQAMMDVAEQPRAPVGPGEVYPHGKLGFPTNSMPRICGSGQGVDKPDTP
jgi:hypothetical protein